MSANKKKNELKHETFAIRSFLIVKVCKQEKRMFSLKVFKAKLIFTGQRKLKCLVPLSQVSYRDDICHFGTYGSLDHPFLPILESYIMIPFFVVMVCTHKILTHPCYSHILGPLIEFSSQLCLESPHSTKRSLL